VLALRKLRDLGAKRPFEILVCGASVPILRQMQCPGFEIAEARHITVHDDCDHALEWCEERLLARAGTSNETVRSMFQRLETLWPANGPQPEELEPYLVRAKVPAGAVLMGQGDPADDMVFLEIGCLTARMESGKRGSVRLRTMSPGSVVGELGLYLGEPRSASIVADEDCQVFRLKKNHGAHGKGAAVARIPIPPRHVADDGLPTCGHQPHASDGIGVVRNLMLVQVQAPWARRLARARGQSAARPLGKLHSSANAPG
jgi:hypothetical protein